MILKKIIPQIFPSFYKNHSKKRRSLKDYFVSLGPGVITGAADNDPAGIVTYILAGAKTGFLTLWLMFFTLPMLIVTEEMSARIGIVTKKGLSKILKEKYGKNIAIFAGIILLVCNLATITADLAGISEVLGIIFGISWKFFVLPLSLFFIWLLIKKNYHSVSHFLFLLTPFFLIFIINGFIINPNWSEALKNTFFPKFILNKNYIYMIAAIVGTTISPYLIFWQATEEIETKASVKKIKEEKFDVVAGMIFCNLIFYFMIISGSVLFSPKSLSIETVGQLALSLKPLVGIYAFGIFSIGLIISGVLAIPVLAASTAYVIAEVFDQKEGLDKDFYKASLFYKIVIFCSLFPVLALFLNLSPVFLLYYSQILQGILLPPLIYFLIRISSDGKIMGKYKIGFLSQFFAWFSFIFITLISLFSIFQFFGFF